MSSLGLMHGLVVLAVIQVILIGWLFHVQNGLKQDGKRKQSELNQIKKLHQLLQDQNNHLNLSLKRANARIGETQDRLTKLNQDLRYLRERQERLQLRGDNNASAYDQAIKLVQRGADVDELINVCGLSRGEADLVIMLHGMKR